MQVYPGDHKFYRKTGKQQNKILLLIGLAALGFNLLILLIAIITGWYLLVIFTFAISLSIIAPFFDTPQMVKNGQLIYYSSLFLAESEKKGVIAIHGGSLFDYYYVIDRNLTGRQRTNFIMQKYIEGLLVLITSHKLNDPPVKIKGTSYILNKRTLKKAGFTVVKTDVLQYLILIYNFFPLTWSLSIAKGKLTFPNLGNVFSYEANLSALIEKKSFLESLNERLKS